MEDGFICQVGSVPGGSAGGKREIYLLKAKELPPEVIAVTFAKTSRSPQSFREIASELTSEKSAEFHEKWVLGYGHASVAEHAVLHIALENVSRLAIEALESTRLASYTEKSTRYQIFSAFYLPRRIVQSPFADLYVETCNHLFATYHSFLDPLRRLIQEWYPRREGESDRAYASRIHSRYIDVCRYLLPCATLANVGVTINARSLEHMISKMLSHPLEEVRAIGEELKTTAAQETPTLVKYAAPNPYLIETQAVLKDLARGAGRQGSMGEEEESVRLVDYTPDAEIKLAASLLYRYGGGSYPQALHYARSLPRHALERILQEALCRLGRFDVPLREFEHITYTFDILCDQGAYFDLKRHRMATQSPQSPTVENGYAIPKAIEEAGLRPAFEQSMEMATEAYRRISKTFPEEAAYLVTNAHNRRFLLTCNLRELYHLVSLRSRSNGHFAYRRIALRMYELVREVHPLLVRYLPLEQPVPTSEELTAQFFATTCHIPKSTEYTSSRS
ncbi:MAG: FAD-dependent thymidylate synthase [Armatimonadota bacterium]|nr:FAD-dependent thymidylate synthase [Armatimonadota bacterium]